MLFNSFEFAVFFLIVLLAYRLLPHRGQNIMLLAASYLFYASWDWRFAPLIFLCTAASYISADQIFKSANTTHRRWWLIASLVVNLGVLGFFKYCNFFIENFNALLGTFGLSAPIPALAIILPMGISFFTFQALSYTIDIYRRTLKPMGNFLDFALFKAFFPLLMAGPIERASHLLPQIVNPRRWTLEGLKQGSFLIFLGLFQKIFVADNLARIVNPVFADPSAFQAVDILVAVYAFTFQIFCDFAGYSNIARGLGAILGFKIMVNFDLPFFVTNVQEFWNRWHISLSSWIRDYLYFPLMGTLRKVPGNARVYLALLISMSLIGLWHGASWHFVVFGLYYGVLLVLYIIFRAHFSRLIEPRSDLGKNLWFWTRVLFMFNLTAFGMLLFRARSMGHLGSILSYLFSLTDPSLVRWDLLFSALGFATPVILLQYGEFRFKDIFFILSWRNWFLRIVVLAFMAYLMFGWGVLTAEEFIYFQF
ncbi:MAG: MBOAT family protein [Candidatus Omnitrophica bacterium]|nr:MBOAT family protein [Candidatus Omnitrophota bacterium]